MQRWKLEYASMDRTNNGERDRCVPPRGRRHSSRRAWAQWRWTFSWDGVTRGAGDDAGGQGRRQAAPAGTAASGSSWDGGGRLQRRRRRRNSGTTARAVGDGAEARGRQGPGQEGAAQTQRRQRSGTRHRGSRRGSGMARSGSLWSTGQVEFRFGTAGCLIPF